MDYARPILTVDAVLFTILSDKLHVLLMQRAQEPFDGKLALPGGYIHVDEDIDAEAGMRRVLADKLGLKIGYLEQLRMFSGPDRDPRGWSASMAFVGMIQPHALSNESMREFYPITRSKSLYGLPELAFDHNEIVRAAVKRVQDKTAYSSLPLFLMPEKFSLFQLQKMYEAVLGTEIDKSNFRRKIVELNIIRPTGKMQKPEEVPHRPAELWTATSQTSKQLKLFNETLQ